jgi:hypothetical protein
MCVKGFSRCSWQNGSLPTVQISVSCFRPFLISQQALSISPTSRDDEKEKHTGFRVFLISESREPPLRAMMGGAASGSWAMGEPHSSQNQRQTDWPEVPLPSHFLTGPFTVSLSLRTTHTRAVVGGQY